MNKICKVLISLGFIGMTMTACSNTSDNHIYSDKDSYHEHNYIPEVVDATYESVGYIRYICTICGDSYIDEETYNGPLEHHYSEEWSYDEYSHFHLCIDEGYENLRGAEASHYFSDWVVDIPASEEKEGSRKRECRICGYHENETIARALPTLDKLKFKLSDDESYYIVYGDDDISGEVVIPLTYNGLPVSVIGPAAFYGCINVTSIAITSAITEIQGSAFFKCNITSFYVNKNVTTIADNAFWHCQSLERIIFEEDSNLSSIGEFVFGECTSLKYVELPSRLRSIGDDIFDHCSSLISIDVKDDNESFTSCDGVLFNKSETTLIRYPEAKDIDNYKIPNKVNCIYRMAFNNCKKLVSIEINEESNIAEIGFGAFYGCIKLTSIFIPKEVRELWSAFRECKSLTNVNIQDGSKLEKIEDYTFESCEKLVSINIPETVKLFGESSFEYCGSLEEINIPENATTIEKNAFRYCTRLTSIKISNVKEIGSSAFANCFALTSVTFGDGVEIIGASAFSGCSHINSLDLPNSLKEIHSSAFSDCSEVTTLIIPNSVTYIGKSAFSGLWNLETIVIPFIGNPESKEEYFSYIFGGEKGRYYDSSIPSNLKTVVIKGNQTSIKEKAFYDCRYIVNIAIPSTITTIDDNAFYNCESLKNVFFSGTKAQWNKIIFGRNNDNIKNASIFFNSEVTSLEYIESDNMSYYLDGNDVYSLEINDNSLTSYDFSAFSNLNIKSISKMPTSLTSITIPSSVVSIDNYAFKDCSSLVSVNFAAGSKLNSIGIRTFNGCSSLAAIELPNSLFSIGSGAFYDCSSLVSIIVPNNVTDITYSVFGNCSSLVSVILGNNVVSIRESAFRNCESLTTLVIPDTVREFSIPYSAYNLVDIYVKVNSYRNFLNVPKRYLDRNIRLLDENNNEITEVVITEDISSIPDFAFNGCSRITSITLSNSITSIGEYVFYNCTSLETVNLSNSINEIATGTFCNCNSLKSIIIPNAVTSIGDYAFYGCKSLTSIVIPNSVTSIGKDILNGCDSIESITLPFIGSSTTENQYLGYLFGTGSYRTHDTYMPTSLKTVIIAGESTSIPDFALNGCSSIVSIEIGGNVTSIGSSAFSCCYSLTSINISSALTSIGDYAFASCTSLTSIVIPNSVTSIGSFVFYYCTSLTSIKYDGTIEEWNAVSKGYNWKEGIPATVVHCSDGDIDLTII